MLIAEISWPEAFQNAAGYISAAAVALGFIYFLVKAL